MSYSFSKSLPRAAGLDAPKPDGGDAAEQAIGERLLRRRELARELGLVDAEISIIMKSICGVPDLQHVELYDGSLGVPRSFVDACEPMIGQLQWEGNLPAEYAGPGEHPGNVSGARWGAGALIGVDLFLTAAHCFNRYPGYGHVIPSRNAVPIDPQEIARRMHVNMNYQLDGPATMAAGADVFRTPVEYPVIELVELGDPIDYAIVRLGEGEDGRLPGERFRVLPIAAADLTTVGATLCVIQHPNGEPKQIEAGTLKEAAGGLIAYDDIDTGGGASGAPILSAAGEIVGVHTTGSCFFSGGFNYGTAIGAIRRVSSVL